MAHHLLAVAVQTLSAEQALAKAEKWLSKRRLGDWWVVGGRWDGQYGMQNVLSAGQDLEGFLRVIDDMLEKRSETWNFARQSLVGSLAMDEESQLAQQDPGLSTRLDTLADRFRNLMDRNLPPIRTDLEIDVEEDDDSYLDMMLAGQLQTLADLLMDRPRVDVGIVDIETNSSDLSGVLSRLDRKPHRQWLVMVDHHD